MLQVMLQLTQQSLTFQQEKAQLTDMLQAQHMQLEYLSEKTKTQEAAINGWTEHAQQADQQVMAFSVTFPSTEDLHGNANMDFFICLFGSTCPHETCWDNSIHARCFGKCDSAFD